MNRVRLTIKDGIADVRMVRVDKMNALDAAMFEALVRTGEAIEVRADVCAVVLSGEGRGFCAGIDMNGLGMLDSAEERARIAERSYGDCNIFQRAVMVWRDLPMPVIAAVHGVAFGGGFQLMLGADMRYVAPDTKLSVMEVRWGLIPDMAGTLLMPDLARDDVIRDLCYSGRIFSGEEGLRLGFATRNCADPLSEAMTAARQIADLSPDAVREAKRLLNARLARDRAAILLAESLAQNWLIERPAHAEAVAAGMAKRKAVFVDSAR
jgi:enoyl-CoA hydratase/carnithine racemase